MSKVKFGDIVRDVKNKVDRNCNPYEFYVAGDHMDTEDLIIHRKGSFATDDVGPAFIREFKTGQVLYGSRRTYLKKVAVADFDGVTANTTFVLETSDDKKFLQELLPFVMLSEGFTQWSIMKSKGSTNPYVLFSDLADYEFELPDIEKQRELAKVLWAMDDTKKSYQKLLQKTNELVKSQFIEMFGENAVNHHGWKVTPLDKVVEKPMSGEWGKDDPDGTGIKVLRTTNFTDQGKIDYSDVVTRKIDDKKANQKSMKYGDVLIEKSGGSDTKPVGRVVFYDGKDDMFLFNNFTSVLRLKPEVGLLPEYLFVFLFVNYWSDGTRIYENKTTGIHNLKLADYLSGTYIPLPPSELQEQFSIFVRQSDKSKSELEQALAELTATYKKIISENLG
jgi:type I restriction enzyme S subunit